MYLGAQINGLFGGRESILNETGMTALQFMPTAPVRWSIKEIPRDKAQKLLDLLVDTQVRRILFHGIYLINLARKDKQKFHLSKMSLVTYLEFADYFNQLIEKYNKELEKKFKLLGICFHPGSAIDLTQEEGVDRIVQGINWIFSKTSKSSRVKLLLETTAGSGNVLGDKLEELSEIREKVEQKNRVGYVLDTEHMFASGYNWRDQPEEVIDQVDQILRLENVASIHLNDSMVDLGSNKDRHANLGEGKIGFAALEKIVQDPRLKNIPFILETPALGEDKGVIKEMETLKSLAGIS